MGIRIRLHQSRITVNVHVSGVTDAITTECRNLDARDKKCEFVNLTHQLSVQHYLNQAKNIDLHFANFNFVLFMVTSFLLVFIHQQGGRRVLLGLGQA